MNASEALMNFIFFLMCLAAIALACLAVYGLVQMLIWLWVSFWIAKTIMILCLVNGGLFLIGLLTGRIIDLRRRRKRDSAS